MTNFVRESKIGPQYSNIKLLKILMEKKKWSRYQRLVRKANGDLGDTTEKQKENC